MKDSSLLLYSDVNNIFEKVLYLNLQTILSKRLMKTGYFFKVNFKYLERFER